MPDKDRVKLKALGKLSINNLNLHPGLFEDLLPRSIILEVTNHCNLCCRHCGQSQFPSLKKGHIEPYILDKIIPLLGKGKIESLGLSYFGESLLSPRWESIFSRVRQIPDITISFITNAVLLHKHWDLFTHPGLNFGVSLDGASERTYSHFRGTGYFGKVVSNLKLLREKELSGVIPTSNRNIIVVLSRINVHEMTKIVKLAKELGFKNVTFTFQVFYNQATFEKESLFFAQDKYDYYLGKAIEESGLLGITLFYPSSFNGKYQLPEPDENFWLYRDKKSRVRCGQIASSYVKYHGQVKACCVPDRYPLGSLQENELLDIWYGSYSRQLRLSFLQNEWMSTCKNCNLWQSIDVRKRQSHLITPDLDDDSHRSLPQPYLITELDKTYQQSIRDLKDVPSNPTKILDRLLYISSFDTLFYEVLNAIGVVWILNRDLDKGKSFFNKALQINPDDEIIKENLAIV